MKTLDELTELLRDVERRYRRLDAACNAAHAAGALDLEGELHRAAWHAFEGWLDHLDGEILFGWVSWWVYDNEFGRMAHEAGLGGKLRPVRTARQMARLILACQKL
jgi:hypothetical protein